MKPDELGPVSQALASPEWGVPPTLDELKRILGKMLKTLSADFDGDEKKARRLLLESAPTKPTNIRGVFDALLPRPKGRKGQDRRLDDATLLFIWKCWQREHPAAGKDQFGRWWDNSQLRDAMKKDGRKIARVTYGKPGRDAPRTIIRRLNRVLAKQNG